MANEWLKPEEVQKLITSRDVYIWGAMVVGQGVCRALERHGIPVRGFIDSSSALQGAQALGYAIGAPEPVLEKAYRGEAFVIVSSGHYDLEIANECERHGVHENKGFLLCRRLCDVDPSIDVSGVCNLHCISCPCGNMETRHATGFMKAAAYGRVLDKLLAEIPLLGNIQLYTWGEPLLNPDLPEIISMTRDAGVLCALSTNLNTKKDFSQTIAARPDWFKVSASGFGPDYEITHTGGNWDLFYNNLLRLAELRELHHSEMQVMLNYHLYRRNIGEEYDKMRDLCRELGFIFRPNHAYLYPLENVMDYAEGKELSPEANQTLAMLLLDIDEGISRARDRRALPCPEERCFPISWDLKIRTCGVCYGSFLEEDFFACTVSSILEKRSKSDLCRRCKNLGLHHFTGVYLQEELIKDDHFGVCSIGGHHGS